MVRTSGGERLAWRAAARRHGARERAKRRGARGGLRVVVEDDGVVGLDESHATHVGSEVEHPLCAFARFDAVGQLAQVQLREGENGRPRVGVS